MNIGLSLQVYYMKKIIFREFLYLLISLILAIPLTYFFLFYFMDLVAEGDIFTENEKNFIAQMYVLGCLCIFIGLVLLRIIIMVIKKMC